MLHADLCRRAQDCRPIHLPGADCHIIRLLGLACMDAGARAFVRGQFFDEAGVLVASAAQECLLRERSTPGAQSPGT